MSTALIWVLFSLLIQREGNQATADNDFIPTLIPLNEWHSGKREERPGTPQETFKTNIKSSSAVVPAHYWEDALRHSVYLTLVRDKIDQLVAKNDFISPDSKKDVSREIDGRDLWDKIKSAPFERIEREEPSTLGDITIMSTGRLLEKNGKFRFTEDENPTEKCGNNSCSTDVKAFWSVKRIRQKDVERTPGRYHYELTFSVNTRVSKEPKKIHENPIRTFTVRESSPEKSIDKSQEYRYYKPLQIVTHKPRAGRAVWLHKNIIPTAHNAFGRQYNPGLDRIFSTFFTREEKYEPPSHRYKQNPHVLPIIPQYSKIGYIDVPSEQHHRKKMMPYPYKPNSFKLSRPLPPPPTPPSQIQQHYLDIDAIGVVNNPFISQQSDYKYTAPSNTVKTTRPVILPTLPAPLQSPKDLDIDVTNKRKPNATENNNNAPEMIIYSKPKPSTIKVNYFPDRVRPPVYNAPPGVFTTMDKKPFKPMPPLKLQHTSTVIGKIMKPPDFKPSPQVLDIQFSEPDPFSDAFRPITVNYNDSNITKEVEVKENTKKHNNSHRKLSSKKPPKKHENIKSQGIMATTPHIIIEHSGSQEESDSIQWANIVSAFTKTTPMVSQKNKEKETTTTTTSLPSTTTTDSTTTARQKTTITTNETATEKTTTTTTTFKPKKRTRPPPSFSKPGKIKKQRFTTTTTRAPETIVKKQATQDLTPQASTADTSSSKLWRDRKPEKSLNKPPTTTTSTQRTFLFMNKIKPSTHFTTTTTKPITTTTETTSTIFTTTQTTMNAKPKGKNRFRQSTLMHKGTSLKHDKWSEPGSERLGTIIPPSGKFPPRRKGSNFQGYVTSSTAKHLEKDRKYESHEDYTSSTQTTKTTTTAEATTVQQRESTLKNSVPQNFNEIQEEYDNNDESQTEYPYDKTEDEYGENYKVENYEGNNEEDSSDHIEYIFHPLSMTSLTEAKEITEAVEPLTTEQTVNTSPHTVSANKTKCKKKKHNNLKSNETSITESNEPAHETSTTTSTTTTTTTTTEIATTPDIFHELFGGFNLDDITAETQGSEKTIKSTLDEQESENHKEKGKNERDFEDFLETLVDNINKDDEKEENEHPKDEIKQYDYNFETEEETSYEDEKDEKDEKESFKELNKGNDYDDYQTRPYKFLELMPMD